MWQCDSDIRCISACVFLHSQMLRTLSVTITMWQCDSDIRCISACVFLHSQMLHTLSSSVFIPAMFITRSRLEHTTVTWCYNWQWLTSDSVAQTVTTTAMTTVRTMFNETHVVLRAAALLTLVSATRCTSRLFGSSAGNSASLLSDGTAAITMLSCTVPYVLLLDSSPLTSPVTVTVAGLTSAFTSADDIYNITTLYSVYRLQPHWTRNCVTVSNKRDWQKWCLWLWTIPRSVSITDICHIFDLLNIWVAGHYETIKKFTKLKKTKKRSQQQHDPRAMNLLLCILLISQTFRIQEYNIITSQQATRMLKAPLLST